MFHLSIKKITCVLAGCILVFSCNSPYVSKKRGYFKIDFPKRKYVSFDSAGFPYSFEFPAYAKIIQDTTYFDETPENPYWINISFPQFNGEIFLSYKIIGGKAYYKVKDSKGVYHDSTGINKFDKLIDDAFNLTSKNDVVSTSIHDSLIE